MGTASGNAFAHEWVRGWNRRDLDALLALYSDDIEFRSPLAVKLLGDPSGTIRGKQALREYFGKALAAFPGDLQIELLAVYQGVNSVVLNFSAKGRKAAEVMEINSAGLVCRALAHVYTE